MKEKSCLGVNIYHGLRKLDDFFKIESEPKDYESLA